MIYKSIDIEQAAVTDNCGVRLYFLSRGDVFVLNDVAIKQSFNISVKDIKLGTLVNGCFIFTQKVKRKRWWQFWKPRYWGAKVMYVGEEIHDA